MYQFRITDGNDYIDTSEQHFVYKTKHGEKPNDTNEDGKQLTYIMKNNSGIVFTEEI